MSIIEKSVSDSKYQFVNSFRGNRSGFVHETILYRNDVEIAKAKVQYYNRTWESYTYQTVMKKAVCGLVDCGLEAYEKVYKMDNNIKRLTAEKRKEMENTLYADMPKNLDELMKLYKML